jgi:hypothetical protein
MLRKEHVRKRVTLVLVGCIAAVVISATVDAVFFRESPSRGNADRPQMTLGTPGGDAASAAISTKDPIYPGGDECHSATLCWSRFVASEAGVRIAGSTGSAWIAKGGGHSFYFWATDRTSAHSLVEEGYRVVRRVAGVEVLTDGVRLAWRLPRATLWVEAGPTQNSTAPTAGELATLIEASRVLASG